MTPSTALTTTTDPQGAVLLKAVGFDRLTPEERALALKIAERYELDVLLRHVVMIEGRAYITRDGLLHVAHKDGAFDGMETTEPVLVDGYWRSTCSVYRKDMSHPFKYTGRYPEGGRNKAYAPEMAVKVGEVMSLRRAFDVAAPAYEERWDTPEAVAAEVPAAPSLAERVRERAEAVRPEALAGNHAVTVGPDGSVTDPVMDGRVSVDDISIESINEAADAEAIAGPTLEEFSALVKAQGVKAAEVKAVVKRLFPDVKKYDELDAGQLQHVLDELAHDLAARVAEAAPEVAEPPTVANGGITTCDDVSPLSGDLCTLDAGHPGRIHRHGVSESWEAAAS